jgi:uncharacterized membrane protein
MKRLAFLDWTRGLAVILMILCHVFNSFTRMEERGEGGYIFSQSIGGMASVLFLFLAGVTLAFGMAGTDRRGDSPLKRWACSVRRGAEILGLAFLFRLSTWAFDYPSAPLHVIWKVDILNCMGAAMLLLSVVALLDPDRRMWAAFGIGCGIIAASPVLAQLDWSGAPKLLQHYIVQQRGVFALFPFAAHLAHGVAAGALLRRLKDTDLAATMKWMAGAGMALLMMGQFASRIPYTLYSKVDYWMNSPALMAIRTGIVLLTLAAAYLWTEYAGHGWSWVQTLGKQSLLVYFVHIMLVYGWVSGTWRKALTVEQSALATVLVMALMVGLAQARIRQTTKA